LKISVLSRKIRNKTCEISVIPSTPTVAINSTRLLRASLLEIFNLIFARIAFSGEWGITKVVSPVLFKG